MKRTLMMTEKNFTQFKKLFKEIIQFKQYSSILTLPFQASQFDAQRMLRIHFR